MRAAILGLLLGAMLARPASAYDAYDPANCNGAESDDRGALTVSKVTAQPRVNFVKSPYDDDFTAAACPAATEACRKGATLVTGDLVLVGKTVAISPASPTSLRWQRNKSGRTAGSRVRR